MRKSKALLAVAVSVALASLVAIAQSSMVDGEVKKVDGSAGKITIKHGPIKSLDMDDGMTMVFRAKDPAMLKGLKSGDKIRFEPANVNGQFTVVKIEKKK